MSDIRVSCVIPAHNAEAYVGQAVRSVLEQTLAPEETVVVDDGSTDGTAKALARFGEAIRVIRQANRGSAAARNAGVQAARGEWIALLDADDWWLPGKCECMQVAVEAHPGAVLIYAGRRVLDEATGEQRDEPITRLDGRVYERLLLGNVLPTSTVLVRRDAWLEAGGMAAELVVCHDWDLWLRLSREHEVRCVPETLAVYRAHAGGISQRRLARMREEEHAILTRALDAARVPARVRRRAWSCHHFRCGMDAYAAGELRTARRCFRSALGRAWHGGAARRYLETLLGARLLRAWLERRRPGDDMSSS